MSEAVIASTVLAIPTIIASFYLLTKKIKKCETICCTCEQDSKTPRDNIEMQRAEPKVIFPR